MSAHLRSVVRDGAASLLSAVGLLQPRRRSCTRLTIATFHRILPAAQRAQYPLKGLVLTPGELEWFLRYFTAHYTCGTLRDTAHRWLAGEHPERPFLALTFDDAQRDNVTHAWPALERAGVKATFFAPVDAVEHDQALWHDQLGFSVVKLCEKPSAEASELFERLQLPAAGAEPERCGLELAREAVAACAKRLTPEERADWLKAAEPLASGDPRPSWDHMASWDDLAALHAGGHEIGSHTLTHELLTQCSDEALARELEGSRSRIEERLNTPVSSFCYPNGDCDDRTAAAVARANYRYAVTTAWGRNPEGADLHTLRRCDMTAEHVLSARGALSHARLAWRLSGWYPGLEGS